VDPPKRHARRWAAGRAVVAIAFVALSASLAAQQPPAGRGAAPGPPPTPRAAAVIDFTGNWVAVVSEDWRWRMITPPKGDYANIPVNAAARKVADAWDPARDEAAGEQCRGYAAPAIMREPTRVRISWQDDYTLKLETDAGIQTRLFRFARPGTPIAPPAAAPAKERSWQGFSVARWEPPPAPAAGRGIPLGLGPRAGTRSRTLEVTTTQIRPGYLRKNGVPFGENATVTEYYDLFREPDGPDWFVVTTIVRDPQYLGEPWITTSHFKKEADGSKWAPTPCQAR
jgi:hypothetical protein